MRIAAFVALLLLVACGATLRQQAHTSINKGELWNAAALLEQAIQRGDTGAWNDLGVVHERLGNRDKAVQFYKMAARWGDSTAQRNLINLGEQVPSPDLASANSQRQAAEAANTAATLQLIRSLQHPAPPTPVTRTINCQSYRVGNSINTTCN
jgi:hypothetical protein